MVLVSLIYMCLHFQGDVKTLKYPGWGYVVITFLIAVSCLFIPVIFVLRRFGILKYNKKASKENDVISPGAMTPNLSRAPLRATEFSMAGAGDG